MSIRVDTRLNMGEILSRADSHLKAVGFTTTKVGESSIEAIGGRDHNIILTAALLLVFVPAGLIYYFRKKKNRITLTAADGSLSITYDGNKAFKRAEELANLIKTT